MTLDQLHILDAIVEWNSLKTAAEKLHKTQPALSIAIKKLEQELKITLLDRSQYRLTLTKEGKQIYIQAKSLLKQKQRLLSLAEHFSNGNETELKFSFDKVVDINPLLSSIKSTQTKYPSTELQLIGEFGMQSLKQLVAGNVDMALAPWLPTFQHLGEFETINYSIMRLIPVISTELLEQQEHIPTSTLDISNIPYLIPVNIEIGFDASTSIDSDMMLRTGGDNVIKVNDIDTLKAMLLQEFGWAIIPEHMVIKELESKKLTKLTTISEFNDIILEARLIKRANTELGNVGNYLWNLVKQNVYGDPSVK